jgi:hypothetical protein
MSRLPPHRPLLFAATFKGFPAFAVATYLQRQGFATWLQSLLNVHPEQRAELSPPPPALHGLGGGGLLRSRGSADVHRPRPRACPVSSAGPPGRLTVPPVLSREASALLAEDHEFHRDRLRRGIGEVPVPGVVVRRPGPLGDVLTEVGR